jgi:hypothetical protein
MLPLENWSQLWRKGQNWQWQVPAGMLEKVQAMDRRDRNWKSRAREHI